MPINFCGLETQAPILVLLDIFGSFFGLILFIVSVDNFLLIDVSFSNLLIAISDKVVRSSFFLIDRFGVQIYRL